MKQDLVFKGFRLFRIDSFGWEAVPGASAFWNPILLGPQGDVWEVCLPDGKKEQFFTYPAAVRELSKASLEFPTAEELEAAAMFADSNDEDPFFVLRGSISGFWHAKHASLYDIKTSAYRWHRASKESARGHATFSAVRTGKLGVVRIRLPSSCAVPVSVRSVSSAARKGKWGSSQNCRQ